MAARRLDEGLANIALRRYTPAMHCTRRSLFGLILAPLLARLPVRFTPKYYSVSISLDEINAVTKAAILPGVADRFFSTDSMLVYLRESKVP